MSLAAFLIRFMSSRSAKRFEQATKQPAETQRDLLMSIIRRNADTEYGRRYNFALINSIEDYQNQVPVISYNDIAEEIARISDAGEKNVLTSEDPVMFAQTSGTTGNPKFIPVTPSCQGENSKDLMRTWVYHARKDHPDLFKGKIVSLVSPAVEGYTDSGVCFGSASGHIYKSMPGVIQKIYAIPYEVFEIENYESKYYAILRIGLQENVSFLATANPSTILKLCEKADEFSDYLISDIRQGTLSESFHIRGDIREVIEKRLMANPARASELEQMRKNRGGRLLAGDYWPDLQLIGCWKGGTVGHYIKKFSGWFDPDNIRPVPVRDWGFLSSEARCSVPLSDIGDAGVLSVAVNFFEFVLADEITTHPDDYRAWRFLTADQLEREGQYYVFLTTTGGLYRYDINDVLEVCGFYNKTPQIRFLRKGRGMTNITGEKLSVNQLIEAIQKAGSEADVLVEHFKAEADPKESRYVIRGQFVKDYDTSSFQNFLSAVDQHLKEINIEYKEKRKSERLRSPVLHVMREGWYERARKEQAASGKRMFQAKTELLSPMKAETMFIQPELKEVVDLEKEAE
jgi:hypothetical protein